MQRIDHRFVAMGGPCRLRADTTHAAAAERALANAEREVRRLDEKYSDFLPTSLVSRINASAGTTCAIDAETYGLLRFAGTLWRESGRLFDPTSAALRRLWRDATSEVPGETQLQEALDLTGWQQVQLAPGRVRLRRGMEIELGGVVKEYAVDRAADILRAAGIRHALVDLAGDMHAIGEQGNGRPWRIGIRQPGAASAVAGWVDVEEAGLATSGDYARGWRIDGQTFSHLINPLTGWPVRGLRSVSVIADRCLVAGAVASLAMLMDADRACNWLGQLGLSVLAIHPRRGPARFAETGKDSFNGVPCQQ